MKVLKNRFSKWNHIYHGRVMPLNRDKADKLVRIVTEQWSKMKQDSEHNV